MKTILTILAAIALALTLLPALLLCAGWVAADTVKHLMTASLALWFAAILPLRRLKDRR